MENGLVEPAAEDICFTSAAVLLAAGPPLQDIGILGMDLFHMSRTAERNGIDAQRQKKSERLAATAVSVFRLDSHLAHPWDSLRWKHQRLALELPWQAL